MTAQLTDRAALMRQRARAVDAGPALFLHEAATDEMQDRISMVNKAFTAPAIITGWPAPWRAAFPEATIIADEPTLALEPETHDLVIHAMALHWSDDPVGQLIQARRALKPDGLFLGVMSGGTTLHQLRASLAQAESEVTGGLSPRIAPTGEVRDLGGLLQRAGLALPVVDSVPLTASYTDMTALMRDLRAMGEGNAMAARPRHFARRAVFDRAAQIYADAFGDGAGRIIATYDLIFLTGWAPHASQQQPLRPGSATTRLADALNTKETPLDD
ncbi:methyltransferase domain-containing protein [Roseovarius sp. M141]|uniref:methyltransferase domain-containing protein n=1 Tax=Roseovarius sp. M141 TaxID=2583806 RepID=UPI0020CD9FCE|nr:methyltransferase domain-containing protein [Roseovarius sp. M141]MCQ0091495.1 methyltransferase domain-containing protein [Roseovarius sp. M141]